MTKIELRRVIFKETENFHGLGSSASLPLNPGNNGNVKLAYVPELRAVEVSWSSLGGDPIDPQFAGPVMIPEHRISRWYVAEKAAAYAAVDEPKKGKALGAA